MIGRRVLQVIAAALLSLAWTASAALFDSRVLVIHDPGFTQGQYSSYFGTLKAQGFELSFRSSSEQTPALFEHEVPMFDHLLLMAPATKSLPVDLSPQKLVSFLQQNGNILFALSSEVSELYRDLAREFEIELEDRGTTLIDHFASIKGDDSHTTVAVPSSDIIRYDGIFAGVQVDQPFLYKGIAHRLGVSPLAFSIVKAPSTSYSFDVPQELASLDRLDNPDRQAILGSDADVSLISAFQLLDTDRRNTDDTPKRHGTRGRAVFCGSLEAFSDEYTSVKDINLNDGSQFRGSSNLAVLNAVSSWLMQRQGVLRVERTSHSRVKMHDNDVRESYEELDIFGDDGSHRLQRMYRLKDTVTYTIDLVQRTPTGWQPAPTDLDLQVSLVMLDPYITTNLSASLPTSLSDTASSLTVSQNNTPRATRYSSTFRLPDRHGVFTFVVDWKRHGWSYIHTRDTAPVRPFNSDEHPRGLHSAWPYVVGASSTVVGFVVFVYIWLVSQDADDSEKVDGKKKQ